jgi:hypothetical protein
MLSEASPLYSSAPLTLEGRPFSFSPHERFGIRSTQVVNFRSLNRHVIIKEGVFSLFPNCPETSTNLANRNSLGVIKRLARPMAIGAKDHAVFLWINLLDYGCLLHPPCRVKMGVTDFVASSFQAFLAGFE